METTNKNESLSDENNSLCRVCLSSNDDNKCIFTSHINLEHEIYSSTDLWEKLQFYGGIEVSQNDGLPAKICNECISKMRIAHEFRTQCQTTDKILRSINNDGAKKNDSTLGYWVKEVEDETEQRECVQGYEFEKLEDLYSDKLNADRVVEISSPFRTLKNSENEISPHIDKEANVKPVIETKVPQTQTIFVLKKVDGNIFQKPCQAFDKSSKCLTVERRSSEFVLRDSLNDITADNAKEDKLISKKEEYRSRRLILFKRATSMTNLKNNKERQRRYIKKTLFAKLDSNNGDNLQNSKTGVRQFPINVSSLTHNCSKCCRSCSSKTALKTHEIIHENKKFACDQCDERFSNFDEFLKHTKTHDSNKNFKTTSCKICNKNFRKVVTMVRHLNVHKRENPRAVYSILKDIRDRKREKNVKISEEFRINIENLNEKMILNDSQDMVREVRKSTAETQDNRSCVSDTNSENDTKVFHKRNLLNHEEMKFTCNVCNAKFLAADNLKIHRENSRHYDDKVSWEQSPPDDRSAIKLINIWIKEELDSDNEGKGFPCNNCSKSYSTKKSLFKHQEKMHPNIITKYCSRCDEDCICIERIKENHKETEEKAFTCDECNKTFEKEVKLEKHMRIHARVKEQQDTNFKRFLCHICSKTFRQNTGLMFHMRTHTGYKPHVCKYCGRGFTSNSNCINHERTHTGDRPFVCHFCSAAFAKSCTLKAHITTHTGEANYHCKTCGKSFRRLKYLKEHRFTHTGEKPYACKICGTAYSHSGSLFVHEKKCKAQEVNCQAVTLPVSQNYRQILTTTIGASSITSIITSLPSSHRINSIDKTLTADPTKNYIENLPRINNSSIHPENQEPSLFT